jgi:hypothetical protein
MPTRTQKAKRTLKKTPWRKAGTQKIRSYIASAKSCPTERCVRAFCAFFGLQPGRDSSGSAAGLNWSALPGRDIQARRPMRVRTWWRVSGSGPLDPCSYRCSHGTRHTTWALVLRMLRTDVMLVAPSLFATQLLSPGPIRPILVALLKG